MDDFEPCEHEHIARVSSHEDLVAANEQGEATASTYVCGQRTCADAARAWVVSTTGRGVTYWIPLRDLEED
jgi:hypothetical protein